MEYGAARSNAVFEKVRWEWTKLNYGFHNPNSAEDTADFLCKLLIEANAGKVERVIEEAALYPESKDYILEKHD